MPIDFIPGMRTAVEPDAHREEREREALREGIRAAARTGATCAAPAAIVLVIAMMAMKSLLVAADQVLRDGDNWISAFMPSMLFGIFGLVLGGLLGWRMAEGAGMSGSWAWRIGSGCVVIVALCGAAAAPFVFSPAIPFMWWLTLGVFALASQPGLSYFAFWAQ